MTQPAQAISRPTAVPAPSVVHEGLHCLLQQRKLLLVERLRSLLPCLKQVPGKRCSADALAADRHAAHQFRTSLRRLRSMAEAFPGHWQGPSAKRLGAMARLAGEVRDLDVLLRELEGHASALPSRERRRLNEAITLLGQRRRKARCQLALHLRNPQPWWQSLLRQREAEVSPGSVDGALPMLQAALMGQMARIRLSPGWGDGHRPCHGSRAETELHQLRKAFKRLRYQLELWEAISPDLRDRLLKLKLVQDALGALQDFAIWQEMLQGTVEDGGAKHRVTKRFPGLVARWHQNLEQTWADWCVQREEWLESEAGFPEWWEWCLQSKAVPARVKE